MENSGLGGGGGGSCRKAPGKGSQQESVEDSDGPGSEMVHFGKGLQPIPRKLVEAIGNGSFVEFADFPLMEEFSRTERKTEEEAG